MWVPVLLQNQPWVGWVMVPEGILALVGRADLGSPSLGPGVVACPLLACQHGIQGWTYCQDQWTDIHQQGHLPSCLLVVPVGSHQAVVGSLQPVEEILLLVEDRPLAVVGSPLLVEDRPQAEEGSRLAVVGSPLFEEGKPQAEVGKRQAVEGRRQAVEGRRQPEEGIQGSSCLLNKRQKYQSKCSNITCFKK